MTESEEPFPLCARSIYKEAQDILSALEVQVVAEEKEEDPFPHDWCALAIPPLPAILILREIHAAAHDPRNDSTVLWSRAAQRISTVCYPWLPWPAQTELQLEMKFGPAALAEASTSYGDGASHADAQLSYGQDAADGSHTEGIDKIDYLTRQRQLIEETHHSAHAGLDVCANGHPFHHVALSTYTCDGCGQDLDIGAELWRCECGVGFCCECRQKEQIGLLSDELLLVTGLVPILQRKEQWKQAEEIIQDLGARVENLEASVAITVLRQRGKIAKQARNFQQAESDFRKAHQLGVKLFGINSSAAASLHELGVLQRELRNFEAARESLRSAWEIRESREMVGFPKAATLLELGRLENELGNGQAAAEFFERAISDIGNTSDEVRHMSIVSYELGRLKLFWGDRDLGLSEKYLLQSLKAENDLGMSDDLAVAQALHAMAMLYFLQSNVPAGRVCLREAVRRKHAVPVVSQGILS